MTNLFGLDISEIRHNGDEVLLIKLNNDVIYEKQKFCIRYTLTNNSSYLSDKFTNGHYTNFPLIYSDPYSYTENNYIITIIKKDGTKLQGYLSSMNLSIKCIEVSEIYVWYPSDTYKISFGYLTTVTQSNSCHVKEIKFCNTSNFGSIGGMFSNIDDLVKIKAINWDTKNVTDMSGAFQDSSYIDILNVSNWNTSNVTNMSYMFYHCFSLDSLDVSKWDTSKVTDMSYMFYNCHGLTELDVSGWNTGQVKNMSYMFDSCVGLTELDVSKWNTGQATNMASMFGDCNNLTTLDLSNFNTSKVTNMHEMFSYCTSLIELDLSSFDTRKTNDMTGMFFGCENLKTLNLSSFDASLLGFLSTGTMFSHCYKLENLQAPKNIKSDIKFSDCTNLTHDSLMSIINNLKTVTSTKTLTLGTTNLAKLTDDEKAIATNKGWTLT